MFTTLLRARRFAPLFWCQFFSALNDNLVKTALGLLILFKIGGSHGPVLVTLATATFIAPFFILSALGGELADRYDKAFVAERIKLVEIAVAALAALGFLLHSMVLLFVALALFGVIGALFGPIKYGILPDHLSTEELSAGNALVEGATFLAILVGTIAGGAFIAGSDNGGAIAIIVMLLAMTTWVTARLIPPTGRAQPDLVITRNPVLSTLALVRELRSDARLWIGGQIVSWFWLVGAVALSLLPVLVKDRLGGSEALVTLALAFFTVGIACGSLVAARASQGRPNLALVPVGAFLMVAFSLMLAAVAWSGAPTGASVGPLDIMLAPGGWWLAVALLGLAFAGGIFIVPSFAAVQSWAPIDRRARVVAAVNVLSAAYMTAGAVAVAAAQGLGAGPGGLFGALALANLIATALVLRAWGRDGVQDVARLLFKFFFRLEIKGAEHLPREGMRAVIAPNHVSLLDGPLMHAILPGHAAFAIDTHIANAWWAKPFMRLVRSYMLDPTKPIATRGLVNALKSDQTIVIFPEGRITVTGGLMKVYDGTAMVAEKADAWIVPVRIEGLERSPFGYLRNGQIRRALLPKTTVTVLPPRKLSVPAELKGRARRLAAGALLQDIMVDAAVETARIDQTLFSALVEAKQTKAAQSLAMEDALGTRLSYRKLILGAQMLGHQLAAEAPRGASVGVLLPNTAAVAATFFALQSIGRVPAMLNYTAGVANMLSACTAARVEVILTSRAFVEKARLGETLRKLEQSVRVLYLEDIRARIGWKDKLRAMLQGTRPQAERKPNDPAVVLFTSGSEGTPKGVVLSHRNILANCAQCLARFAANGQDKVFNVLPVFHSFGMTGGLIMPLVGGIPVYLYPSPLHYRIVPELVYGSNATILFGTDTFLNGYARAAHAYDFHQLRLIMAGAEAVKERTRQVYVDKFGVRILEGYGVTETAPVLAMNTLIANRPGTVGRLSPLMEARLEPVPGIEEGGRLLVRGPNVMLGYYRAENPGVLEPPADGWHDTGDIVAIDVDGYLRIKGRAKRFAKIGGEMVTLAAVEGMAAELWPGALSVVVSVPDARKGERLILVTECGDATREALLRHARLKGASELSVPAEIMHVARVPLLGSGKPDYVAATALARDRSASPPSLAAGPAAA
jgi:acyl-[acyl-carrier-protein]-phospholipid O-acyltransferase/long-chain-fatty-acid--[acyl-carrier-protein] ligase